MEKALLVVLGVIVGALVAVGVALAIDGESDANRPVTSFPAVEHDPDAADGLVAAWERWRTATFVSEGTWTRTLDGVTEPLTGSVYTAQDPPRRLVVRRGSTIEQIDRAVATCDSSNEEIIAPVCLAADSGLSFDQRVDAELVVVGGYVDGRSRLYDVGRAAPGCYQVELKAALSTVPWGRWAEFCFDPATGALASARVRRQSAIDVEIIDVIRTVVSEDDFG